MSTHIYGNFEICISVPLTFSSMKSFKMNQLTRGVYFFFIWLVERPQLREEPIPYGKNFFFTHVRKNFRKYLEFRSIVTKNRNLEKIQLNIVSLTLFQNEFFVRGIILLFCYVWKHFGLFPYSEPAPIKNHVFDSFVATLSYYIYNTWKTASWVSWKFPKINIELKELIAFIC